MLDVKQSSSLLPMKSIVEQSNSSASDTISELPSAFPMNLFCGCPSSEFSVGHENIIFLAKDGEGTSSSRPLHELMPGESIDSEPNLSNRVQGVFLPLFFLCFLFP